MIASSSKLKSVSESESSFNASSKPVKKHHCLKFHRPIWLLCYWARQFTHTVLHSTQVCKDCKMASTNKILKGSLWWISILFREGGRGGGGGGQTSYSQQTRIWVPAWWATWKAPQHVRQESITKMQWDMRKFFLVVTNYMSDKWV